MSNTVAPVLALTDTTNPTPVIWVTIEPAPLDAGVPMTHQLFNSGHLRVAYDPNQCTYDAMRAILAAEYGPGVLTTVPAGEPTPAQAHAMAELSRLVWESDDPQAAAREVLDVISASRLADLLAEHHVTQVPAGGVTVAEPTFVAARGRRFLTVPTGADPGETLEFVRQAFAVEASQPVACPVYSWCTQYGQHDAHVGDAVTVPSARPGEADYLDAVLVHLDGSKPCLGIGNADLTADQAHREADKLREFAARVDAMADLLAAAEVHA